MHLRFSADILISLDTAGGKKIFFSTSIYCDSLPYKVNFKIVYINYDEFEEKGLDCRPKLMICVGSP